MLVFVNLSESWGVGNFGDIDAGVSHYESSFYYENATAKCHIGVLLVDY